MPGYGEPVGRPQYYRVKNLHRFRHDGFYLRLAGGLGTASDSVQSNRGLRVNGQEPSSATPFDAGAAGFATTTELALGWTVVDGLVLGAGVYTATVPSATAKADNAETVDYEYRVSQQALVCPLADYYWDAESGFHIQGGIGLATYIAGVAVPVGAGPLAQAHTAVGFGFMAGAGYEWFVSSTWSLGLLARVVYGSTSGNDSQGLAWSHSTLSPAALVTATYH